MDSHGALCEESVREANATGFEVFDASGANASGFEVSVGASIFVDAILHEFEDILHDDDIAFHADDFGDVGNFSGAALKAAGLDDEVDCGGDLFADCEHGQIEAAHVNESFDTGDGIAGVICVHCGE